MSIIKGQNFRVLIGSKIVAASTSCSLNLSADMENASTKDSTGSWKEQECTGKSWDGSADALVVVDSQEIGLVAFDATELIGTKVAIKFEQTEGTKNRQSVSGGVSYSGEAWVTSVSLTAGNKQNATYSIQFQGEGALIKPNRRVAGDNQPLG